MSRGAALAGRVRVFADDLAVDLVEGFRQGRAQAVADAHEGPGVDVAQAARGQHRLERRVGQAGARDGATGRQDEVIRQAELAARHEGRVLAEDLGEGAQAGLVAPEDGHALVAGGDDLGGFLRAIHERGRGRVGRSPVVELGGFGLCAARRAAAQVGGALPARRLVLGHVLLLLVVILIAVIHGAFLGVAMVAPLVAVARYVSVVGGLTADSLAFGVFRLGIAALVIGVIGVVAVLRNVGLARVLATLTIGAILLALLGVLLVAGVLLTGVVGASLGLGRLGPVATMRVVVVLGVVAVLGNVGVALLVTGGGIAQLGVLLGGFHDLVLRVLGVLLLDRGLPGGRGFLVHGVAEHVAQVGSHLRGGTRGRRVRAVLGPVLRV